MMSCMVVSEIILQQNRKKGGGRTAMGKDALCFSKDTPLLELEKWIGVSLFLDHFGNMMYNSKIDF